MALNFDKIISESENVSLEDLCIESLVQTDLDSNVITFNDLFEDHLAIRDEINNIKDDLSNHCFFDVDVDCTDIDKVWISDCDISDSFQFDNLNLADFEPNKQHNISSSDNEDSFINDDSLVNGSSDIAKKNVIIRRQSTRIQNQTRKKIAEQIQRENIRLAMEAQLLNNKKYAKKRSINNHVIDEGLISPAMQRYLLMPTDLDAEDDEEEIDNTEVTSDDDPNKLWCICRQPYGDRFMICCDNCMEWYHGDCVGVTQKEGSDMDEFTCPQCIVNTSANVTPKKREEVVIIDDEEEEDNDNELLCIDDEDCLITKSVEPMKFNSNIFQLINKDQPETDKPVPLEVKAPSLSKRTSVCLNQGCKTLVNPKKSLYCSRGCIDKYTKMVIKSNLREKASQYGLPKGPKLAKMTRFVLAQPATETIQDEIAAPTEDNLKEFLLKNPTYKVYQSSKPIKSKQNQEKSKKFLELINKDPSKHIKIVKHFATLFKKSISQKQFKAEFSSIWQHCVQMEEGVFEACDKTINDKYMTKIKELSECLKKPENSKLCSEIIHDKLTVADLLSMTKDQLEARSKFIILEDDLLSSTEKPELSKKTFSTSTGIVSLLSDTTHLHSRHLYDIKCKVCNGTSKSGNETKVKEKETPQPLEKVIPTSTEISNPEKVPSPPNNDEFKVTSSVKTPDLVVDMDICSTPSEKGENEPNHKNGVIPNSKVDTLSADHHKINDINKSTKSQKRKLASLWEGSLTYKEVGSVECKSYLVTRYLLSKPNEQDKESSMDNDDDIRDNINLTSSIDSQIVINGRSEMKQVQDYLRRLRRHSNKEFLVLRLHPSNLVEGRQTYLSMFEYLHSRERCGVMKLNKPGVKDCFVYPLNAHAQIPSIFLPFVGPGLEKKRPHLLLLLVVRNPLSKMSYQPISPKYDQEHDFVKKHGINIDNYYHINPNLPFCPSPIASGVDVANYVINQRAHVENELCEVEAVMDETETEKSTSEDASETQREADVIKNINVDIEVDKAKKESKKPDEKIDTEKEKEHRNPIFEIINKVVSNSKKAQTSETPINAILDIPLPPEIDDVVTKVPLKVPTSSKNLPDPSLLPQPFIYRSQPRYGSNPPTKVPPNTNHDTTPPQSSANATSVLSALKSNLSNITTFPKSNQSIFDPSPKSNQPLNHVTHVHDDSSFLSTPIESNKDIDFRVTNVEEEDSKPVDVEIVPGAVSQNPHLKRKHSSRIYTFYETFDESDESSKKRQAYFFNPRCPDSEHIPESSPAVNRARDCVDFGRSILKRNISVFSPPGDSRTL